MGCLNSGQGFGHWFGNIHLSGPCNRRCYFCIGQHMMPLDGYNTLDSDPLPGIDRFIDACLAHRVREVNLTGTNTDPSLYRHTASLKKRLTNRIPGLVFGIRTNGVVTRDLHLFDKGSFSITSTDPMVYHETMGGPMPDYYHWYRHVELLNWKINIVLTPGGLPGLIETIQDLCRAGFRRFNLREPYGQERIGDPLASDFDPDEKTIHGMPTYTMFGASVTYWDVHYCEVESVNLYASGRVSLDYPITRGHDDAGVVKDQSNFKGHKRRTEQWVTPLVEGVEAMS